MTKSDVQVRGLENLQRGLHNLADGLEDMTPAHRQVGSIVRTAGAGRAPKRSGRLAASLTASTAKDHAEVRSGLPYAGVIHYGWPRHHIAANPFLSTAAQSTESTWSKVIGARVTSLVNKIRGV